MKAELLRTLTITNNVGACVNSVAINSSERLVAAGGDDKVRVLQSFVRMYSEYNSYRWCVSGTLAPVNCWRRCGDTHVACGMWRSPLMGVD